MSDKPEGLEPTPEEQQQFNRLFAMYGCLSHVHRRVAMLRRAVYPTPAEAEQIQRYVDHMREHEGVEPEMVDLPDPPIVEEILKVERESQAELERAYGILREFMNQHPEKSFRAFSEEAIQNFIIPNFEDEEE